MTTIALVLGAYLLGSISFAVVVSRAMRMPDPRSYGSKNPGATNVLRTGKKAAALLTLLGDSAKGWLAVHVAQRYAGAGFEADVVAACGLAVVIGHIWPIFFRWQGGKGVSTALGVLFGFNVWLALGTLATWLVVAAIFRISSLAALVAALMASLFALLLHGPEHAIFWSTLAISALLFWRHRSNIRNLLAGTEGRLGRNNTG
jgi:glycerol-3-phosphate acyltransferase PlsY